MTDGKVFLPAKTGDTVVSYTGKGIGIVLYQRREGSYLLKMGNSGWIRMHDKAFKRFHPESRLL